MYTSYTNVRISFDSIPIVCNLIGKFNQRTMALQLHHTAVISSHITEDPQFIQHLVQISRKKAPTLRFTGPLFSVTIWRY